MDRIEFFQSVDQKNRAYDSVITSLFDQFSALYDIVAQYDSISISNSTEKNRVQFDISSEPSKIDYIYNQINNGNKLMVVYGNLFEISTDKMSEDTLQIRFSKKRQQINTLS